MPRIRELNIYQSELPTGPHNAITDVAAVHTINGFGKVAGFEQVCELGNLETPIALTGTLNVPRVADVVQVMQQYGRSLIQQK